MSQATTAVFLRRHCERCKRETTHLWQTRPQGYRCQLCSTFKAGSPVAVDQPTMTKSLTWADALEAMFSIAKENESLRAQVASTADLNNHHRSERDRLLQVVCPGTIGGPVSVDVACEHLERERKAKTKLQDDLHLCANIAQGEKDAELEAGAFHTHSTAIREVQLLREAWLVKARQ